MGQVTSINQLQSVSPVLGPYPPIYINTTLIPDLTSRRYTSRLAPRAEVDWASLTLDTPNDHFPDFSFAGAFSSSRQLPPATIPAFIKLQSTNDTTDRTAEIQAAINKAGMAGGGIVEVQR